MCFYISNYTLHIRIQSFSFVSWSLLSKLNFLNLLTFRFHSKIFIKLEIRVSQNLSRKSGGRPVKCQGWERRPFPSSPGLCFKTRLSTQPLISHYGSCLIWKWFFILMQIKLIFSREAVLLASIWKWGLLELGSGLLGAEMYSGCVNLVPRFSLLSDRIFVSRFPSYRSIGKSEKGFEKLSA